MNTDIEKITQEYQDFAYIVSHDLNAPLRHVREFTRLIIGSRQSDPLNEEEKEYIQFLERSLARLDEMQKALLQFSRITTQGSAFEKINTQALLDQIVNDFKNTHNGDNIQCGNLPDCYGDSEQIYTVFYNIIANSIKFARLDVTPAIKITASQNENRVVFQIKDNGIGIEEQHVESVFQLFRKLHSADQYPGVGVGLTLSKKIIERHNCKIWMESTPNMGSSVFFSLPEYIA